MALYGIRGTANNLFKSYLSGRKQYVKYQNTNSSYKEIKFGVPQGSILGPLLFLLYINDLPNCSNAEFILFADDTSILFKNKNINSLYASMNDGLINLVSWMNANKL
jgi:retron-type reverse transcriptase